MPITRILDVEIDQVTFEGALDQIEGFIEQQGPHQVVTVNPEFIMRAQHDREFRKVLNNADLAVADGAGLLWASRIVNRRQRKTHPHNHRNHALPERVTGTDLVPALAELAEHHRWKIYLLGGMPGIAQRAADELKKHFPELKIAGAESGALLNEEGKPLNTNQKALLESVVERIVHAKPHILFVAFGAPKQDRFIARYAKELNVPVMIGVGGAFDFIAGTAKRAPVIFRILWLEWLWRLIVEPWRAKRIWTATVKFPLTVLTRR